jgi:hypothetical protein
MNFIKKFFAKLDTCLKSKDKGSCGCKASTCEPKEDKENKTDSCC